MQDPSTDPNRHLLSPETDRLLDRELEEITGDPEARVPRRYRARFHAAGISDIVELRFGLIIAALILAMVGAITLVSGGGVVVLIGVVVLLLGATAAVVVMTLRLTGPTEHPSPELEARLVAEGWATPTACSPTSSTSSSTARRFRLAQPPERQVHRRLDCLSVWLERPPRLPST